ncbi:uncharacterized protein LOC116935827 [Daphnia magna]|uniref:uncharacterized protein LOC116935827 n=1 Tax=Daphnia magna TaxID=35525 RepID=UPI001E1BC3CD|nr:uncharacterized protein LOC116935827 [Daphnia magna]
MIKQYDSTAVNSREIRQFIMANVVKCSMCPMLISSENPSTFFDHVRFNHRNTKKFHVVCKYPDCHDEYNLYISFKRHWYKNHGRRALVTVPNHPLVNHDRDGQLLEAVNDNIQIENLYRDNNIPDVQHNSHHHVIEKSLLSVNDNDVKKQLSQLMSTEIAHQRILQLCYRILIVKFNW